MGVSETRFTTGTMYTDKLFTGQREMAGLGIYHYGARFYSSKLGRFLSADTIVPGYANPQNLNRCSYVINNPLKYTDPTGHAQPCEVGDVCQGPNTTPSPAPGNGGEGGGSNGEEDSNGLITIVPNGPACSDFLLGCVDLYGGYSPDLPGWYYYYNLNLVCPADLHCTAAQMQHYLSRFVFPGQDPTDPVTDRERNWVPGLGFIRTRISLDGLMVTNLTEPLHLMRNGQVIRMAGQARMAHGM